MPALHLNKEQVADLFTDYTKVKNNPIISEEVKTAETAAGSETASHKKAV